MATSVPAVLSVFRVVFGLLFLSCGVAVVLGWPAAAGLTAQAGAWPFGAVAYWNS